MPVTPISTQPQFSLFPDYPRETPIVDDKGQLTMLWDLGLGTLFQTLQANYTAQGIKIPQLSATDIASIASVYQQYVTVQLPAGIPDLTGLMVFDITNNVPKIFIIKYIGTPPTVLSAAWYTFTIT